MIFVTVGSVLSFDRLVRAVDEWAIKNNRSDIFAQIGPTNLRPRQFESQPHLKPDDFRERFKSADLVVGHAGIGTILMALELEKPLVVMPRRAELGEHTSNHQVATARRFASCRGIPVAYELSDLENLLDRADTIKPGTDTGSNTSGNLIAEIRKFILE